MLIITETTDTLQIKLGASHTTRAIDTYVSYRDRTATTFTPARQISASNGATDANILNSPSASHQLIVDSIIIYNADTVLHDVTIKIDANGTEKILWRGDMASLSRLEYAEGTGFIYTPPKPQGYAINVQALTSSPADAATYYIGMKPIALTSTAGANKIYIRKAGTIKIAEIYTYAGTAGTAEQIDMYVRKNNTTDTLIQSLSVSTNERVFSNTNLSIAVAVGDYIEIKMVCPTWATNPLTFILGGYIYIE